MDITTIIGIIFGITCIILGQFLEGGHPGSIVQGAAALIVFGGTFGAVVASFPPQDLRRAMRQIPTLFRPPVQASKSMVTGLVDLARRSRREGLLVLEDESTRAQDRFMKRALQTLVDGHDANTLRSILEGFLDQDEQFQEAGPLFFEKAGAYAPTIGIIGAVLGLIHVMENLADPSELGAGIAVAFVATIYGVAIANLVFLPIAAKMQRQIQEDSRRKEMIIEGAVAIQEGVNPLQLERRLQIFLEDDA